MVKGNNPIDFMVKCQHLLYKKNTVYNYYENIIWMPYKINKVSKTHLKDFCTNILN